MKHMTRIACLLLSVLLLVGCAPSGPDMESTAAPETSGAVLAVGAEKTEQAIADIQKLGESPDYNNSTF